MAISPAALPPTSAGDIAGLEAATPNATRHGRQADRGVDRIDLDLGAVGDPHERIGDAEHGGDAELACGDAGVAHLATVHGDERAGDRQHAVERRRRRGRDEDITGTQPGDGVLGIDRDDGAPAVGRPGRCPCRRAPSGRRPGRRPSSGPRNVPIAAAIRRRSGGNTDGSGGAWSSPSTAGGTHDVNRRRFAARVASVAAVGASGRAEQRIHLASGRVEHVVGVLDGAGLVRGGSRPPSSARRARPSGHMQLMPAWSSREATARRATSSTGPLSAGDAAVGSERPRAATMDDTTTWGSSTRRRPVTSKAPTDPLAVLVEVGVERRRRGGGRGCEHRRASAGRHLRRRARRPRRAGAAPGLPSTRWRRPARSAIASAGVRPRSAASSTWMPTGTPAAPTSEKCSRSPVGELGHARRDVGGEGVVVEGVGIDGLQRPQRRQSRRAELIEPPPEVAAPALRPASAARAWRLRRRSRGGRG